MALSKEEQANIYAPFPIKNREEWTIRKPIVLVTGLTGQDSSYMIDLLLEKGTYEVHGTMRRSSSPNTFRVSKTISSVKTHLMDLSDSTSINKVITEVKPDIVFNLAAQSDVRASYDIPEYTLDVTGLGVGRLLEACRIHVPHVKFYQAGSSEMFGKVEAIPQNETTPFHPRSPYGCAKVLAFSLGRAYREGYGMQIYNGILFNHESPRRGELFVTKKIVKAAVEIKQGKRKKLILGNIDAKRDWGYSRDYMEAILQFIETQEPQDFVVATGETHTVEEWITETFNYLELGDWKNYVEFNDNLKRPAEVDLLLGDASKIKRLMNWEPKTKFKDLIKLMCDSELDENKNL